MQLDTKELSKITVLYVEDSELVRSQTEKFLNKLFKKVHIAVDGLDGLNLFKENSDEIDVIITDINMPNMNGFEMLVEITKLNNSIAKIVTTAHSDSDNLLKAIEANVDKYITKPIQVKELTVAIVDLVVKYRRINNIESLAKNLAQKTTITDKENNELNYELERTKYENAFLNSIVQNIVINFKTDKNGNILQVSNKFKTFFGYADDIIGQNINVLKCESCKQESFQKLMLKAIHTKKTVMSTYTFTTNNDRKLEAEVTMTPTYGENSLINGYTFYLDQL